MGYKILVSVENSQLDHIILDFAILKRRRILLRDLLRVTFDAFFQTLHKIDMGEEWFRI